MFEEFLENLEDEFHPDKVILFGSRAWGKPRSDSDYDLMVIMDSDESKSHHRAAQVLEKCHPGDISIDLFVRTPSEISERLKIGDSFVRKILEEGKIIHERNHKRMGGQGLF